MRLILAFLALSSLPALAHHVFLDCSDSYAALRVHEGNDQGVTIPRRVTLNGKSLEELGQTEALGAKQVLSKHETPMTSVVHFLQHMELTDATGRKTTWHLVCTTAFGF